MKEISDILSAYQNAKKHNLRAALATVVNVEGSSYRRPGARMLVTEDGMLTGAISGGCLEGDALKKALSAIHQQENKLITYDTTDEDDAKFGVQLGCNGIVHILFEPIKDLGITPISILNALLEKREDSIITTLFSLNGKNQLGTILLYRKEDFIGVVADELIIDIKDSLTKKKSSYKKYLFNNEEVDAFIEFISPPIALVIAGAGNDAQPLADIAYLLGWQVTVVDGRRTHATMQRFAQAKNVLIAKPMQLVSQLAIDEQTAIVLMTHNYNYDTELLGLLLKTEAPYIGTLGPKKKLMKMLDELDMNTEAYRLRIHGPVGLDIGAETAAEIAISIIAEIKSVFSGATAKPLKEKSDPIHIHYTNPL